VLNQPVYQQAQILLTRKNFGCGSSREHAPWALLDFGFRAIIAPSFADIFYNNCFKNGILPIVLTEAQVDDLFQHVYQHSGYCVTVDLPRQQIQDNAGLVWSFAVDEFKKTCLLHGLDDISLTLQQADRILAYEQQAKQRTPWLFSTH
jgi:3-isopropylmalate/(R)-2-methylmalate dehydratase small subunit